MENQDLENASLIFLQDVLYLKNAQRLLMYTDQGSDEITLKAIQECAQKVGVQADIFDLQSFSQLSDRINALTSRIEAENYDVVCELSEQYFYPTKVWQKAIEKGCRVYALGAIDAGSFIRCIGKVNHEKLFQFGHQLYNLLKQTKFILIQSDQGTHITYEMNSPNLLQKVLVKLRLIQRSCVWHPSGKLEQKSSATFMGGQIAFLGIPGTIEGTAVIDGYFWPPKEIGRLEDPIILKINKGHVERIEGCPTKSKILRQWLNGKEKGIEHFCVGFNPGARLSSNIVEAERAFGHIVIGVGKYPFHTDGIIKNPKLVLNDRVLMENGSFVHESLAALENDLSLPPRS